MIYPNDVAPSLTLATTDGSTNYTLEESNPSKFTVVVFYRGKHCPLCINFLTEIEEHIDEVHDAGLKIVAVSMDNKERATDTVDMVASKLNKKKLTFPVAYGLTEKQARVWGLYISSARVNSNEPNVFSEPGMFVLRPNNTVFMAQVQSAPFTRPDIKQLVWGLNYAYENNYPARGNITKEVDNVHQDVSGATDLQ